MFFRCNSEFQAQLAGGAFVDYRIGDFISADDPIARSHSQYFEAVDAIPEDVADLVESSADVRRQIINVRSRHTDGEIPAGVQQRIARLDRHLTNANETINAAIEDRDEKMDALKRTALGTPGAVLSGDGTRIDRRPDRSNDQQGELRRMLDGHISRNLLESGAAERVEKLTLTGETTERDLARKWAHATGSDAYASAFVKMLTNPSRATLLLTNEERAAYAQAFELRTALGLSTGGGAELVPLTLDPSINLMNAGSINPLRQISRVVQTVTSSWKGITSAGATAEWKSEHSQAADGTPAVDDVVIPVHLGDVDAIFSYEVGMDAPQFLVELKKVLVDAADNHNAIAYTTGSGNGQPKGIVTALAGTVAEINATGEALTAGHIYAVQGDLPARWQPNAKWMMHLATANTAAQFESGNGARVFPEIGEGRLLRRDLFENSNMDSVINPAATESNYVIVYGDFSNFVIADRIGATLELLPGFGANQRPTAQKHAFMTWRTGSDVLIPNAFRMLDVPTAA